VLEVVVVPVVEPVLELPLVCAATGTAAMEVAAAMKRQER
jgi:hypothetical protein